MNLTIEFPQKQQPVLPTNPLWRVKHDTQIYAEKFTYPGHGQYYHASGWEWRTDGRKYNAYPEVFWLLGAEDIRLPFTEEWQWLSYKLNPQIAKDKWREVYDDWRAFMNGSGFDHLPPTDPEYQPKRDYVNNRDKNAATLPKWDKIRVCGGATISGRRDGDTVIVDTLDFYNPPTIEWLAARPWYYFHALSIGYTVDANGNKILVNGKPIPYLDPFPQNGIYPTLIPIISDREIRIPYGSVKEVQYKDIDWDKDPYRLYY